MHIRQFSTEETAFLAWAFGETIRMSGGERFDASADYLIEDWQDLTGQLLPEDFVNFVTAVHAAQ